MLKKKKKKTFKRKNFKNHFQKSKKVIKLKTKLKLKKKKFQRRNTKRTKMKNFKLKI